MIRWIARRVAGEARRPGHPVRRRIHLATQISIIVDPWLVPLVTYLVHR
jgi:hypothetical protein